MCGITGFFDCRKKYPVQKELLTKMMRVLEHRGPDGSNHYVNDEIALGFNRLSIIDVDNGMQPFYNENNTIILICNGEIFNYKELKHQLEIKGHRFRTNSDCEVIIHLYEEHGVELLNLLNGQFAFALYDTQSHTVFCARDHLGIAPFFYTIIDDVFIFGSEIKAIFEHPLVSREIDLVGLDQVLTFPGVISPRTLFKNIKSLQGGHYLLVSESHIKDIEYWDMFYPKQNEIVYKDENYYFEHLNELLLKSVKYRLQSDVPVGFYLSGGLDSSLIAALIHEIDPTPQHSISVDFTDKIISESKYQKIIAEKVGSYHNTILFELRDLDKHLRKTIWHSETLLKESYNVASLLLSERAKEKNLKVILTGEGSDELFAGYVGYRFDIMRNENPASVDPEEAKIRELLWGSPLFIYEKNYLKHEELKKKLFSSTINGIHSEMSYLNNQVVRKDRIAERHLVHQRSYIDLKLRLGNHLLADHGDRMCFANSVEARYPFLDVNILEFVRKIPHHLKLNQFKEKFILKKIASNRVPEEIISRPKFGFVAPGCPDLLRENASYLNDVLSYDTIRRQGFFNPDTIEQLKTKYLSPDYKLNLKFEEDLLMHVLTFGLLLGEFKVSNL
ncbi:asparagine synthase (glutamine-hydrolyzing) [Paenibacillus periandrae]|uniref:asparagine synthase (glutamine-hydrolyzing) n=1 Tax=Paenibacillus periandrae TaxID=1761741 RepID=UPI001F090B9D|nr:asparagine synthase (glutamine-hydrolyzing) [Paenibacillus periandrae]